MIKAQRRRHFQAWCILALLLPAGFLGALAVQPRPVTGNLLQPEESKVLPVLLQEIRAKNFSVRLRTSLGAAAPQQLEWINTAVLPYPTAVIYLADAGDTAIRNAQLIGRIEARGRYCFPLPAVKTKSLHFFVYDFIKEQLIDSIDFRLPSNP